MNLSKEQSIGKEAPVSLVSLEDQRRFLLSVVGRALDAPMRSAQGASDIVQDTLIEATDANAILSKLAPRQQFAWLKTAALNNVRDRRRKVVREKVVLSQAEPATRQHENDVAFVCIRREQIERVRAALATLRDDYRLAIQYRISTS